VESLGQDIPEDPKYRQQEAGAGGGADGGLDRLMAAAARLEKILEQTLDNYAALRAEHHKLKEDYNALKARTESVGNELDMTIASLKLLMSAQTVQGKTNGKDSAVSKEIGHG
jgi:hypothetical protein